MSAATPTSALAGELTINEAAARRDELLGLLAGVPPGPGAMALDLAQVLAFDTAGLQLLLALRHSLALRARSLQLVDTPDCVSAVLDTYRLAPTDLHPIRDAA